MITTIGYFLTGIAVWGAMTIGGVALTAYLIGRSYAEEAVRNGREED